MVGGKASNQDPPKPFGLDQINVPTWQTDEPHTYFAGVASLNVDWICNPVITKSQNAQTGNAGK